jgi:hypothetical protein
LLLHLKNINNSVFSFVSLLVIKPSIAYTNIRNH